MATTDADTLATLAFRDAWRASHPTAPLDDGERADQILNLLRTAPADDPRRVRVEQLLDIARQRRAAQEQPL